MTQTISVLLGMALSMPPSSVPISKAVDVNQHQQPQEVSTQITQTQESKIKPFASSYQNTNPTLKLKTTKQQTSTETKNVISQTITKATPKPQPKQTPTTQLNLADNQTKTHLDENLLFNLVNTYRNGLGKPSFQKHPQVCQVADQRRPQLEAEIYQNKGIHAGFRAMNLAYRMTENMIYQQNETAALSWWLNSPIHRRAIESDHQYACTACSGKVCVMIFSSLEPKPNLDKQLAQQ